MIQRVKCPISGEKSEIIFSRPYESIELNVARLNSRVRSLYIDKHYEIRRCKESGLHFQTWVMEDGELCNHYCSPNDDSHFFEVIEKHRLYHFAHLTEEILLLRQMLSVKRPIVLDFGCSWGKWASMALAHGCDVYGTDVNPQASAFCSSRGIKMLGLSEITGYQFDFINVDQVLEHLSDPFGVAQLLSNSLRPGGLIKWSTPGATNLPSQLILAQSRGDYSVLSSKDFGALEPIEHINLFSNFSLRFLARRVNLTPIRLPFWKSLGASQLWNIPRQFNRNLITPWKRWRSNGTYLWLQKTP